MEKKKIIIVEDEVIISNDIKQYLKKLNYEVLATFNSAEELLEKIKDFLPDIILMDINFKDKIDGIKAAKEIKNKYNIPIIFLTAFCDAETLQRAKETEPFGYILKPYNEKELYTSIEIALYKAKSEKALKEKEEWILAILKSIGDAVIVTDSKGYILFMNNKAEELTGWNENEVKGEKMNSFFKISEEIDKNKKSFSIPMAIKENLILVSRNGERIRIRETATPVKDGTGKIQGIVVVFNKIDT